MTLYELRYNVFIATLVEHSRADQQRLREWCRSAGTPSSPPPHSHGDSRRFTERLFSNTRPCRAGVKRSVVLVVLVVCHVGKSLERGSNAAPKIAAGHGQHRAWHGVVPARHHCCSPTPTKRLGIFIIIAITTRISGEMAR
ncbi:unnamed protein product [Lampetra planeri]